MGDYVLQLYMTMVYNNPLVAGSLFTQPGFPMGMSRGTLAGWPIRETRLN